MNIFRWLPDWVPPTLWACLIFTLSHMSSPPTPSHVAVNDKIAHAFVYAILAGLVFRALYQSTNYGRAASIAFIVSAVYGITDEFHQYFVPYRDPSIYDWYADLVGAGIMCILAWFVTRSIHRMQPETVPSPS